MGGEDGPSSSASGAKNSLYASSSSCEIMARCVRGRLCLKSRDRSGDFSAKEPVAPLACQHMCVVLNESSDGGTNSNKQTSEPTSEQGQVRILTENTGWLEIFKNAPKDIVQYRISPTLIGPAS